MRRGELRPQGGSGACCSSRGFRPQAEAPHLQHRRATHDAVLVASAFRRKLRARNTDDPLANREAGEGTGRAAVSSPLPPAGGVLAAWCHDLTPRALRAESAEGPVASAGRRERRLMQFSWLPPSGGSSCLQHELFAPERRSCCFYAATGSHFAASAGGMACSPLAVT